MDKVLHNYNEVFKFSVLINGSPTGFFPSVRGLRQGAHLSPFLFILAMKGLSDMLKSAHVNNRIRCFTMNEGNSLGVSNFHLQYVDDTLEGTTKKPKGYLHPV